MDGSKYRPKGNGAMGGGKKPSYVLLLLLALAIAALGVVVLHKTREHRVLVVLLQERDRQLISTQMLLEKEKAFNKDKKMKVEELKAKTSSLRTQRTDLKNKIMELETAATNLKNTQRELELAVAEKESRINRMKGDSIVSNPDQMAALMEILQQKEAELEEIKIKFQDYKKTDRKGASSTSITSQTDSRNATSDTAVLNRNANSKNSDNSTVTESNHQEVGSSEEKWLVHDGLQERTSNVNALEINDKSVDEADKETDESDKNSKDSLSDADAKSIISVKDDETKQPNNKHKKRKFRSKRKKTTDVAATNVDAEVIKERVVDATENKE